ncbi:MAG: hypothetical protein FWE59_04405 [Oscillospiraceae bacterium]|nr:hypothetical protein [Oscillospiraceae bacterium]
MKNKKKLILFVVALTLVVGLVLGGTLMLWSAMSDTATNVAEMDNADLIIRESGGALYRASGNTNDFTHVPENSVYVTGANSEGWQGENVINKIVDGDWSGFDRWTEVRPGDVLAKAPDVMNTGSIPLYVKVAGEFKMTPPSRYAFFAALEAETGSADPDDWEEYLAPIIGKLVESLAATNNWEDWYGAETTFSLDYDTGEITVYGAWYYVEGTGTSGNAELKPLAAGAAANDIFKAIQIPIELPNAFHNFILSIDLTAYGVQSDNVIVDSFGGPVAWDAIFPEDSSEYGAWGIMNPRQYGINPSNASAIFGMLETLRD